MNDDYIVVHRRMNANNGEIVVAMIDDEGDCEALFIRKTDTFTHSARK